MMMHPDIILTLVNKRGLCIILPWIQGDDILAREKVIPHVLCHHYAHTSMFVLKT